MTIDGRPTRREDDSETKTETSAPTAGELIEGVDYYLEGGLFVFTEHFLRQRGYCCENDCRHCPYQHRKSKRA